ncbi:MAG TPA: hypothetical protein VF813_02005 [Anaerolineaceae bacterium]
MFIGAYVCPNFILFLIGLGLFFVLMSPKAVGAVIRRALLRYVLFSAAFSAAGLALYIALFIANERIEIGVPGTTSLPGDIFAQGLVGLLIFLVAVAGILSPILISVITAKMTKS